ncbi:MAG: succinylglutamate desuccinylase/aspartoacylase family protein [Nanoarchaeota archaeon]|nr:succinylglutamate desuccinylase/aspartoacylase family protein [Nanoarchaeota archaeon]
MRRRRKEKKGLIQRISYPAFKILTGSDLSSRKLPAISVASVHAGPKVWITACAHGDEVGGIVVVQEVLKRLKKSPLIKGSVLAFPMMNPLGFENQSRNISPSEEDLNRKFPGDKNGSLAERISDKIFTTILDTKPDLVIDLHNDWRDSIPYTLIDFSPGAKCKDTYEKVKSFSKRTGFVIITEQETDPDAEGLKKTLSYSLIKKDIPAIVLELGEPNVVNENYVEDGVVSIWNLLVSLGMVAKVEDPFNYKTPDFLKEKILNYSLSPTSSTSGIIRFYAKPGDIVKKGQIIAKIYNSYGELEESLLAVQDGIVLGHSDSSVAFPGAPVMAFGIIDDKQD